MALTTANPIAIFSEELNFAKTNRTETAGYLLAIIQSILAKGEDWLISGFGKFCVRY